jgi:hypothetical protein
MDAKDYMFGVKWKSQDVTYVRGWNLFSFLEEPCTEEVVIYYNDKVIVRFGGEVKRGEVNNFLNQYCLTLERLSKLENV